MQILLLASQVNYQALICCWPVTPFCFLAWDGWRSRDKLLFHFCTLWEYSDEKQVRSPARERHLTLVRCSRQRTRVEMQFLSQGLPAAYRPRATRHRVRLQQLQDTYHPFFTEESSHTLQLISQILLSFLPQRYFSYNAPSNNSQSCSVERFRSMKIGQQWNSRGEGIKSVPRKPAYQRKRSLGHPYARIRLIKSGIEPGSPWREVSSFSTTLHTYFKYKKSFFLITQPEKFGEFDDLQDKLYSLMYKYADVNCALIVCCHSGSRRLGHRSPGGVKHHSDNWASSVTEYIRAQRRKGEAGLASDWLLQAAEGSLLAGLLAAWLGLAAAVLTRARIGFPLTSRVTVWALQQFVSQVRVPAEPEECSVAHSRYTSLRQRVLLETGPDVRTCVSGERCGEDVGKRNCTDILVGRFRKTRGKRTKDWRIGNGTPILPGASPARPGHTNHSLFGRGHNLVMDRLTVPCVVRIVTTRVNPSDPGRACSMMPIFHIKGGKPSCRRMTRLPG
ncbi:hypothetical protein PR048_023781 [Dryococelus australis]|uniref:Uncharacterized protein n=1 Tax=Dryococelus australis TaxID=614101 RepID=A0ABQ9GV81_9NEOP|nr:hypothetical protein PR048_023781 [Dryococelus australis]